MEKNRYFLITLLINQRMNYIIVLILTLFLMNMDTVENVYNILMNYLNILHPNCKHF